MDRITLNDRYDVTIERQFLSGAQALVRLMLMQQEIDHRRGLRTAGFVTGYRGSPLGGLDRQFARAEKHLKAHNITFQAGLNEELAATAVWGSQQAEMRGEGAYDGVFAMWYGKGPGVDRCGDVFRHANAAGSSRHGGVLVLMGDDHSAESSTVPHQSEFAMLDAMIPVLNPAGVQEVLTYGLAGIAMSRFAGTWVGLKCVHDNIESAATVDAGVDQALGTSLPDFAMPPDGLNIRADDDRFQQERRLHTYKRQAAVAFARANKLDRVVFAGGSDPRIGIISAGKSYLDVRQALEDLGIDEPSASRLGLKLLKLALVWPVDQQLIGEFARGLDVVIVVEEKRAFIEPQVREVLQLRRNDAVLIGKEDEEGRELFPAYGTLDPGRIAIEIGDRLNTSTDPDVRACVMEYRQALVAASNSEDIVSRSPFFCAGCPHNSSTVLPGGARGYAGIGCHWLVQFMPERLTQGSTQMGGEGANWIGEAPFSKRQHVFQNLGDGTYNHSGLLAIRAAVAANVNITYKILYNDAVAMTGGQRNDGNLSVPLIAQQVNAEGIRRIAVVSDEPEKYSRGAGFPPDVSFHHRDDIQAVQKELMLVGGVSVLIYDQTCAAEKRRRRKRGDFPAAKQRVVINELVCEGCGDCGVQSNCVAVVPVDTPFGRKRQIDQSVCNSDYSCLKGFCPSFVTIEGAEPRVPDGIGKAQHVPFPVLPSPALPTLNQPWTIIVAGVGGTGVITIGHVLGQAAHIEGKGAGLIDMTGISQKNGAVVTHLKFARQLQDLSALRIAAGGADLLLGCDLVTSASQRVMATVSASRTQAVINACEIMTSDFVRDPDFHLPAVALLGRLEKHARATYTTDFTALAVALMGDSIAANMMTVGYAWQKGLIPLAEPAILKAIELNGVAVELNKRAFLWGRRTAHDHSAVHAVLEKARPSQTGPEPLEQLIERRVAFLGDYQNAAYSSEYRCFVEAVLRGEQKVRPDKTDLTETVARGLFKLMAYKDEYEVARLFADGEFKAAVESRFQGGTLRYHLAPPLLARRDPVSGMPRKTTYGSWIIQLFRVLRRLKFLRGTLLDPFGYTAERKCERELINEYRAIVTELLARLSAANHTLAVDIARYPERIRGFGHVKKASLEKVRKTLNDQLVQLRHTCEDCAPVCVEAQQARV